MCSISGNLVNCLLVVVVGPKRALSCSYLVAETLRGDDGNLIADSLVGLKVQGQLGIIPLNDDLGGLLHRLGTNATHDCGCETGVLSSCVRAGSEFLQNFPCVW